MDNKNIFATNLKRHMALKEKTRNDLANDLGISYYTVTDWVKGKKYPRMDKVEMLADYFGILKSDLIEDKTKKITTEDLTDGEKALLDLFRLLPTDKQQIAVEMIRAALQVKQ